MVPPSKQDRVASATLTMENPRGKFGDTDLSHLNLHLKMVFNGFPSHNRCSST